MGYLLTLPFVVLVMLMSWLLLQMRVPNDFLATPAFLVTVLIAWIWGAGPAIVASVLGILALDFFFLQGENMTFELRETLPLFPFLFAQLVVAVIIAQRESARQQALFAQQELQERANELEQVNQTKDRFLSLASHELKTPITLISIQVQLGLRRVAKQKEVSPEAAALRELLEQINLQTHQLQGLVRDILDLSLLGAKQIPLRIERCDLSAKCRAISQALGTGSGRATVLQLPPTPVMLDADCERLGQVIINLVTNAIKYSPEATPIRIAISQSDCAVTIRVHNEGRAIPHEQQEHLFEPFYRTPEAHASPEEGCGLGLAISKEIVERHQGRIWVASSDQEGTTFFVWLPLNPLL